MFIFSSSSAGAIAGGVIGGIVGLAVIATIVVCVCVKICKTQNHGQVLVYPQQPVVYTSSSTSFQSNMKDLVDEKSLLFLIFSIIYTCLNIHFGFHHLYEYLLYNFSYTTRISSATSSCLSLSATNVFEWTASFLL